MNELTVEQAQELYDFLQGKFIPDGYKINPPKLTAKKAFTTIWFLQEYFNIIPDNFEVCEYCDSIFDTNNSGHYCDCENCGQINSCTEEHDTSFYNILKTLNGKFFCGQACEHRYLEENGE